MSDVNANIGINFDTSQALSSLRQLQAGLSRFNQSLTQGNVAAANAQKGLNDQLVQAINATGKFVATQKAVATSTSSFTTALEKNQLSMREYFRYTAAAATANTKTFTRMFASEREVFNRARKDRVKLLQSQYVQLTGANGDLVKVLQVVPKHLRMVNGQYADYATRVQMAAQRQQMLNQLLKQGSTQLLNFGKNTQWAGRQLMVGLTIPLSMLGSYAAKTFMEMEEAVVKFTRVYGDMNTTMGDTKDAVASIQLLGKEFTKYGVAVKDTMEMAGTAAAMGLTGSALNAQVIAATRLGVLGQVEQQQALETTISLQNAFGVSSEQLAQKINFLNAVENQTVLSIEDLTIAIPKAGPVVKQLGGSVEDLAFFMTAMKEGGINASEGANALKSGLASLINPSDKASKFLASLGINIKGIVEANAGNLKNTVIGFSQALDTLDPLNRARAIEQLFGKFQFARLSTLFQNVTKDGSQAGRALELAGKSVEELAILSERELAKVEDATGVKFKKAIENLKNELIPVGKAFLEAATPIVKFVGRLLERFNSLSAGTKKTIAVVMGVIGGLAPIALMTFGLMANGIANLIKFFAMLRGGVAKLNGQNNVLGGSFDYLTNQEIENLAETNALHSTHKELISTFNVEKTAVDSLAAAYGNASNQARTLAASAPGLFNAVPGASGAVSGLPPVKKYASGVLSVPGQKGAGDTVPAMLSPGEAVIPAKENKKYGPLVAAIIGDKLPGFSEGIAKVGGSQSSSIGSAGALPGYIQKEYDRIANLSAANLKRYAELTGMGVDKSMDEIRSAILTNFEQLLADVKTRFGSISQEGLTEVGKKFDPEKGHSPMGAWFDKFDQQQKQQFSHVGSTKEVQDPGYESQALKLDPKAQNQLDVIRKFYGDRGEDMPDLKIADAHAFKLKGTINRGMADQSSAAAFESKNGAGSLGGAFQQDFAETGVEKWKDMTTMLGHDFEQIKSEAKIYDDALLTKITQWNTENAEAGFPEIMTDEVFEQLESSVRTDIAELIPEFGLVVEEAKRSITAIRISVGEDFAELSAYLEANNAGTLGPKASNAKILNHEARPGDAKLLGTFETDGLSTAVSEDLTRAEQVAETASPSRRTRRLGKDIGEGLRLGIESSTASVQRQSDTLVDAAVPSQVDVPNLLKYEEMKNDPEMRQTQKSIDRHYRGMYGSSGVPASTTANPGSAVTTTDVSLEIDRKTIIALGKAAQKAREISLEKQKIASEAELEAARLRESAARLEAEKAKQDASKSPTTIKEDDIKAAKQRAADAAIRAANAKTEAEDASAKTAKAEKEASDKKFAKVKEKEASGATKDAGKVKEDIHEKKKKKASVKTAEMSTDQTKTVRQTSDTLTDIRDTTKSSAKTLEKTGDILTDSKKLETAIAASTGTRAVAVDDAVKTQEEINAIQDQAKASAQRSARADEVLAKLKESQAQQAAGTPGIPSTYIQDPDEAHDIANTFTRDKNGSVLIDKETGNPTTLTKKQLSQKYRGMRRESVGRVSGKVSGALGMATMAAGMAGAPPQVTAALGGASMVAQMAPMLAGLSGPQGIAVAAVAAAGALYLFDKASERAAKAQVEYANSTQATISRMKAVGEITGKVGASELMDRRRSTAKNDRYSTLYDRKGSQFGTTFLASDVGKGISAGYGKNVAADSKLANKKMSLELAKYVSDGVMTGVQAADVARQLAIDFGDMTIESKIVGELNRLIGPNGEDLLTNPLGIRVKLIEEEQALGEAVQTNLAEAIAKRDSGMDNAASQVIKFFGGMPAAAIMGQKAPGFTAYSLKEMFGTSGEEKQASLGAATGANNVAAAGAQLDSYRIAMEDKIKELAAQKELTKDKAKQATIEAQIATLKGQQVDGERELRKKIKQSVEDNVALFKIAQRRGAVENAFMDANKESVRSKYKGTNMEAFVDPMLGKTADLESKNLEVRINTIVASGQINPLVMTQLLETFAGDETELNRQLNIGMRLHGAAKFALLVQNLGIVEDETVNKELTVKINALKGEEFDNMTATLTQLATIDDKDFNINLWLGKDSDKALKKLQNLQKKLERIEKLPDPITKDIIIDQQDKSGDPLMKDAMAGVIANWEYFGALPEEIRKTAIQTYVSEYIVIDPESVLAAQKTKAAAAGGENTVAGQYYMSAAGATAVRQELSFNATKPQYSTIPPGPEKPKNTKDTGGDKANPLEFLNDLAMRLKQVRDQSFNALTPLQSILAAFSNSKTKKDVGTMFEKFKGIQQTLLGLKVPPEFKDYIMNLSAEEFEALKNADLNAKAKGVQSFFTYEEKRDKKGKILKDKKGNTLYDKSRIKAISKDGEAFMQAYREANLGESQLPNEEIMQYIDEQNTAYNMLRESGMSVAAALETVEDQTKANAIANGAWAKKTLAEQQAYVDWVEKGNAALRRQELLKRLRTENEDATFQIDNYVALAGQLKEAGYSVEQIDMVLSNPDLAKELVEDLKDGKIETEEILTNLSNIPKMKMVKIKAMFEAGDYAGTAKEAMQYVNEGFAVQENMIRTGADPRTTDDVDTLNANTNLIADLEAELLAPQRAIELINNEIQDAQREIEMTYTRPIQKLQDEIEVLDRQLEMNPIFGNRAMKAIQDENTLMSNDLAVISHAAQLVNEKYDEQAKALSKVQEINQNIIEQQGKQLNLANALSSGDIAAAAQAAQEMRAGAAQQFAQGQTNALQQARENALKGLTGPQSGLTQEQIQEKQYENSQKLYRMENDPARLSILASIQTKNDSIYELQVKQKDELVKIQKLEDDIYQIQEDQIEPITRQISELVYQNSLIQARIDKLVRETTFLGQTREEWARINAKVDAAAFAAKDLNEVYGLLLDSVTAIDNMWASILAKMAMAASGNFGGGGGGGGSNGVVSDEDLMSTDLATANEDYFTNNVMPHVKDGTATGSEILDYVTAAKQAIKASGDPNWESALIALSSGGIVPKYFLNGGMARGTDTVPAMLTPGEFVMSRYAVQSHGIDRMKAINNGNSATDSVYNYSINVNVKSDANPNDIARVVMAQIKQIDSQKIRGSRF